MRKPSFFERLTGSISPDDYDDLFEGGPQQRAQQRQPRPSAVQYEDEDDYAHDIPVQHAQQQRPQPHPMDDFDEDEHPDAIWQDTTRSAVPAPEPEEGELAVDVYQTNDSIVVKALVAGVSPNSLDISLTRDMITIRGSRSEHTETSEDNYFYKELFWGSFTRTILLPEEVDVDNAEATTDHGILVVRLPKINKERKTKLKVKVR